MPLIKWVYIVLNVRIIICTVCLCMSVHSHEYMYLGEFDLIFSTWRLEKDEKWKGLSFPDTSKDFTGDQTWGSHHPQAGLVSWEIYTAPQPHLTLHPTSMCAFLKMETTDSGKCDALRYCVLLGEWQGRGQHTSRECSKSGQWWIHEGFHISFFPLDSGNCLIPHPGYFPPFPLPSEP